jgi:hypothetical protein
VGKPKAFTSSPLPSTPPCQPSKFLGRHKFSGLWRSGRNPDQGANTYTGAGRKRGAEQPDACRVVHATDASASASSRRQLRPVLRVDGAEGKALGPLKLEASSRNMPAKMLDRQEIHPAGESGASRTHSTAPHAGPGAGDLPVRSRYHRPDLLREHSTERGWEPPPPLPGQVRESYGPAHLTSGLASCVLKSFIFSHYICSCHITTNVVKLCT